ncbi:MAG: MFS transporter [Bacilli bacterium]|nr:MFS transporter [Bacilli bacterium]
MKTKKPLLILIVTAFASFLATFNETFLNIAFTPIMKDFGVSVGTVQWLTTAYMLGAAIMVPISSFMYRKFKTKPLFLFTVCLLIVGSLICALAPNFEILLTGRIIQSLGTGMLIPIGMNLTLSVVPKERIGTYMGIMGAMTTLGPSLSIISAGALLSVGSWQLLFWIFLILTSILFIIACIILGKSEKMDKPRLDVLSVIFVSLSLIGMLYGISTIFSGNIVIALFGLFLGFLFLVLFVKRQRSIKEPLINLDVLKVREFKIGIILNMLGLMLVFSMNIIMPLFIQNALNVPAFTASLTLFPAILCSCITAPIAGRIYDKQGCKNIVPLGFLLIFVFIVLLGLTRNMNSLLLIGMLYVPVIIGSALIIGPVQSFALSHLDKSQNSHGVTMTSTGFQIAGCVGSSLFTGIYSFMIGVGNVSGLTDGEGLSFAFLVTLLVAALISFTGFLISLFVKRYENVVVSEKDLTLRTIMKKDVFTVNENDDLLSVLQLLMNKKISGAPVVDKDSNLIGFISDGDIMKYLSKSHPLFVNAYSLAAINNENIFDEKLASLMKSKASDVAKKKIVTIDINTSLEEVCRILNDKHLKKSPVMENGKMVGIINRSNITKYAIDTYLSILK